MSTDPRLAAELRVMTKAERRVLRQLSIAYAQMTRQIRAWESSSRVGAQVSAAQARVLQTSLRAQMAAMWRAVGNEVRAGRLEAAQLAQQPSKGVLDYFRAAGLTPSEVAQLAESTLAAAEQTVDTALRRMLGESYIPLSDQVWRTQVLVDGRLDTVINTTLLKGVNARQLAQAVRGFVRPDARGGTRYAANRLARTEINNAFHAANVSEMQAEPFTTFIQWHLSGSHPKPDECNQYAEKTHVKGQEAGVYEKANVPRRPHPNCLCYTTGLTVERDEFIAAFQQFVTHSQTLFPLLRHCVIQILRENRMRRQGNHAAGCRISTVVLCLFLVLFHISPQRGRNIDQPQNNTYLSKLSPSTQQMDGAKVDENCPPATEHSPQTSEFQISRSSSSSKSQALSTSEP